MTSPRPTTSSTRTLSSPIRLATKLFSRDLQTMVVSEETSCGYDFKGRHKRSLPQSLKEEDERQSNDMRGGSLKGGAHLHAETIDSGRVSEGWERLFTV